MEKVLTFTQEQKSLIWSAKVAPKGGTADDAKVFVEICETYGLNPLLGDIVFNRYESRQGPVVNYVTTRDGYLKAAMRDPNYVRVMGNVVKEGDHFQMNTVDGSVEHRFGTKRGNILGAWAIAEHKVRGRLPVFVDFDEYFRANAQSQNGRSPIWDSMPSAMIQKVAEVFVLRRQFPLGGIVAQEEIGLNEDLEKTVETGDTIPVQTTVPTQTEIRAEKQPVRTEKPKAEKKEKAAPVIEIKKEEPKTIEETAKPVQPVKTEVESETKEDKPKQTVEAPKQEQNEVPMQEETPVQEEVAKEEPVQAPKQEGGRDIYTINRIEVGKTGQGTAFAKLELNGPNGMVLVLAKGDEKVQMLDEYQEGNKIHADIQSLNGFNFLQSLERVA